MSLEDEREVFERAHKTWAASDLEGFLATVHPDIVYTVNVDGYLVPYASSAIGKSDVRDRLQLLLDTFDIVRFHPELVQHDVDSSHSRVHGRYRHKRTGEILDIRVRFVVWIEDGLITRMNEYHDAQYIHCFERFVTFLQETAAQRADGK